MPACVCVSVCYEVQKIAHLSYQMHLPSKVLVLGCFLTQNQELVLLARNFRILIKDALEVLCRDWINNLLVFLSPHFRVQIQDRVVGLMRPDAV